MCIPFVQSGSTFSTVVLFRCNSGTANHQKSRCNHLFAIVRHAKSHRNHVFFVALPDMFFRANGDLFQNSQKHDGLQQFVIEYALNLLFFDKKTKHRTKL